MAEPRLVIVDTDAGVDDAHAILMLLAANWRHLVNVIAITTVRGNVGTDQVCLNVLRTLKVAGRLDIPVYRGCDRTLIGTQNVLAVHYHGDDGFGDVPDPDAPDLSYVQPENAVTTLVKLVNQHAGKIALLCIGPLTNIALALRLDPDFGKKLQQCFVMGGSTSGKGNISTTAEFNFFVDPEAANVALVQLKCPLTLVPWDLCLEHSFSWEWYRKFISTPTPRCRFLRSIQSLAVEKYYSGGQSDDVDRQGYITCDEIAAAVLLDEKVCSAASTVACRVDCEGRHTRGQMFVDWTNRQRRPVNVRLVTKIDVERFDLLIQQSVAEDDENCS